MKSKLKSLLPDVIKPWLRFLAYGYARKRFFREIEIRKEQNRQIKELFDPTAAKVIVFLIPGADLKTGRETISGGVLSIVSIAENTAQLKQVHKAETIVCTLAGDPLLLKYRNFENNTTLFRFSQVLRYFNKAKEVMVHVPEFMLDLFWSGLTNHEKKWLQSRKFFHLNIMNQNIRLMPPQEEIAAFISRTDKITITTAHQKYCNAYYRDHYRVPIHKLSVWISPEQYECRPWQNKENLLVVSPDGHPEKKEILAMLRNVNGLIVREIRNLKYAEYKSLIASAKWSLTFGEGLDAYLIESIFSGAVGIALYNEDFFTPDFKNLPTIYPDLESLQKKITEDIARFDGTSDGEKYQQEQFKLCAHYYSKKEYLNNLAAFYNSDYTYP